jgi:hypothetical protein
MPLSTDPVRRARQLENLRPAGAVKHGATSEGKVAPLRAQHCSALLQRFPGLDEQRRSLLADLLARIELAGEFIDVHGLMRNTRQPHPVLELLSRWERRAWEMLSALEAEHRAQRESRAETDRPPIQDLLDPTVRKHTTAALVAINDARRRRLGLQPMDAGTRPRRGVGDELYGPIRLGDRHTDAPGLKVSANGTPPTGVALD